MDFLRPPAKITDVFKVITRTQTGRELLEKFLPLFHGRKVEILPYPIEVVQKLLGVLGHDQPIGACFTTDGSQGTIYYHSDSPLGILAPFLVHEIAHCLEPRLWKAAAEPTSKATRNDLMLRTELHAFETQFRFTQELKERYPEYQAFLKAHFPKAKILHDRLSEEQIKDLYDLKIA